MAMDHELLLVSCEGLRASTIRTNPIAKTTKGMTSITAGAKMTATQDQ